MLYLSLWMYNQVSNSQSVISNPLQNPILNLNSKLILNNVGSIPLKKENIYALFQARQVWEYFAFKRMHSLSTLFLSCQSKWLCFSPVSRDPCKQNVDFVHISKVSMLLMSIEGIECESIWGLGQAVRYRTSNSRKYNTELVKIPPAPIACSSP